MIKKHLRDILWTIAGTAILAAGLGLTALGLAGVANANVYTEYDSDDTSFYYYC